MRTIGIKVTAMILAAVAITSNAVLASVGLDCPIAAGQTQHLRWWVPITVGATGGVRCQVVVPAGGALYNVSIKLYNTVAPSLTTAALTATAAFTNALANAGTHWLEVEADIVNGATAGTCDLQIAQNTSDILTLTVLRGGFLDVTKL
jgi:hypothetical protein